ncbi:extracellular solute-binding protein [Acetobacter vaccinii]|uniref:Extracellular solute-binding protein n=1 Tax=Acetobacter vaccinii TaxID=2592655 RepID=A0A5C1YLI2_9PROT|nr:extracellular solute-binding protein [Acetobacter vaccinii]QEO16833.1 extracellular solute-binding protein [Acetobacter vaccinii]
MLPLIRPVFMSVLAASLLCVSACKRHDGGTSAALCYPATKDHPLEDTLAVDTSGGTFWTFYGNAHFKPFTQHCGVAVHAAVSAHNFAQLRGYVHNHSVPYDVSYTGSPWEFEEGIKEGLFHRLPDDFWKPLASALLPGSYNAYGTWLSTYAEVLVYDTRVFAKAPTTWADLWNTKEFPGPRTLYDHPYMLVIALLSDGVPPDEIYPLTDDKLRRAFGRLDQIRPSVRAFWSTGDEPIQGINRGDFTIGVAQSGRAVSGIANHFPIGMSWKQNVLSHAWLFIPEGGQHVVSAEALLAFVNNAQQQAEFAKNTGYGGGARDIAQFLTPQQSAVVTTSPENLAQSVAINDDWWRAHGARTARLWQAWVTTGKSGL